MRRIKWGSECGQVCNSFFWVTSVIFCHSQRCEQDVHNSGIHSNYLFTYGEDWHVVRLSFSMSITPSADVWWIFAGQAVIDKLKMFQPLLFLGPVWSWSCWIAIFRFCAVFSGFLMFMGVWGFFSCVTTVYHFKSTGTMKSFTHLAEFGFCTILHLNSFPQ